ncbi:MAG: hypothetical protein R2726_18725 [Acidimicrobiales bacterium]
MQRSLDYCWPTSGGRCTTSPSDWWRPGWRRSPSREAAAAQRRYSITPAGQDALRGWLATGSAVPRFQNEPLLRVLFADHGTVEDLRRVLAELRSHVADRRRLGIAQMAPYLDGEGLFQERAHIVVLVADLVSRIMGALDDWAASVEQIAADWDTTHALGMTDDARALLEQLIATERERIGHEVDSG